MSWRARSRRRRCGAVLVVTSTVYLTGLFLYADTVIGIIRYVHTWRDVPSSSPLHLPTWGVWTDNTTEHLVRLVKDRLPRDEPLGDTVGGNDSFVRASVVYMPSDSEPHYTEEFRWHHLSWLASQSFQPFRWRLDLVVVSDKWLHVFQQLGCTEGVRTGPEEPSQCLVWSSYRSVQRDPSDQLSHYRVVDSVRAVHCSHSAGVTSPYHYILRTDLDTFLTPRFARWRPDPWGSLQVGSGGYMSPCGGGRPLITCHRLRRVARDLNWTDRGVINVGSTWYGPPSWRSTAGGWRGVTGTTLHVT